MDFDTFKSHFITELAGLTTTRITTLWKKSKTQSHIETLESIAASRAAQVKDKQRRGQEPDPALIQTIKHVDVQDVQLESKVGTEMRHNDGAASPNADVIPLIKDDSLLPDRAEESDSKSDAGFVYPSWWEETCERIDINIDELRAVTDSHIAIIISHRGNVGPKIGRYISAVDTLLYLRSRVDTPIDVIGELKRLS